MQCLTHSQKHGLEAFFNRVLNEDPKHRSLDEANEEEAKLKYKREHQNSPDDLALRDKKKPISDLVNHQEILYSEMDGILLPFGYQPYVLTD